MQTQWHKLSLTDGALRLIPSAPTNTKPVSWIERDLENLIALNPHLIDVEGQLPLRLGGVRTTVTSPDQAYVDDLGRTTVVEAKKITAGLPVLAQVIAYADHWRMLPPGEINADLRKLATHRGRAHEFGRALLELRNWSIGGSTSLPTPDKLDLAGECALKRLGLKWTGHPLLNSDQGPLPMVGAPARIIAVAPAFNDDCIEFAEMLSQRMAAVELIAFKIVKSRGEMYVGRQIVHRDENCEPTWQVLRRIWNNADPLIRNHFKVNGWADALNRESFSLSHRDNPNARLWFNASDNEASVWSVVPDGWYKEDRDRRKLLREQFVRALEPDDASQRWLEWDYRMPMESAKLDKRIREVARVVDSILVPGAPKC